MLLVAHCLGLLVVWGSWSSSPLSRGPLFIPIFSSSETPSSGPSSAYYGTASDPTILRKWRRGPFSFSNSLAIPCDWLILSSPIYCRPVTVGLKSMSSYGAACGIPRLLRTLASISPSLLASALMACCSASCTSYACFSFWSLSSMAL